MSPQPQPLTSEDVVAALAADDMQDPQRRSQLLLSLAKQVESQRLTEAVASHARAKAEAAAQEG